MIIKRPDTLRRESPLYFDPVLNQQCRWNNSGLDLDYHPYTYAAWLQPLGNVTGNPYVFSGWPAPSFTEPLFGMRCYAFSGDRFLGFRPNSRYATSVTTIDWSSWYHVVMTDKGGDSSAGTYASDNLSFSINGTYEGRNGSSGGSSTSYGGYKVVVLGNRPQPEGSDGGEYEGYMAHMAIWKRVLLDSEISQLANGASPLWFPKGLSWYSALTDRSPVEVINGHYARYDYVATPVASSDDMLPVKIRQPYWIEDPIRFIFMGIGITTTDLVVDNLSQSTTVQKATITTTYNATVDNLSQGNTVQKPTLVQLHVLSVDSLSQSTTVEKINLVSESALAVDNLSQSSAVDKFSITQLHILQVEDLSQSSTVDSLILQAQGYLAIFPLSQSSTVDKVGITKQSDIDAYDLSQSTTVDKITFSGGLVNLTVDNLSQSTTLTKLGVFTQYATVYPRALTNTQTVGHISLTQQHVIQDVADLSQDTTLDKAAVWANNNIDVKNLSNTNTATKISMTQVHVLVIPGAYVNTTVSNVGLWDWWYEIVEGVGLVTQAPDVVGYITRSHEGYGFIRQTEEQDGLIEQTLEEDGSIVQTYDVEGEIVMEYEGIGEI